MPRLSPADAEENKPAPDSLVEGTPEGARYQLFRALKAMARGEFMVVERKIPKVAEHLNDGKKREAWFRSLRNAADWQGTQDIIPLFVPGTAFPVVVGQILIRSGCCAPSERPHWVPNLRLFFLTDTGRESLKKAQAWWSGLSPVERMRAMVME